MRLIDADKLLKQSQLEPMGNGEYKEVWVVYEEDIDNAPTVDPVRHGRWIIEPGIGMKCSNCEFDIGNDLDWMEYVCYCPHCGAKMDKQNTAGLGKE